MRIKEIIRKFEDWDYEGIWEDRDINFKIGIWL